ncbi:SAF domain-containing protein [Aeromicrobium sp. CTD01-1L150]|uniref:SAF domain-containing protein n=1 Tax=Aeromicrobium sp. CTD01-1L150 TaxID=3341830 RepID=UPI0035BF364D
MDRFRHLLLHHRRLIAAALAGLAVLTALASVRTQTPETSTVVVSARDLASGTRLTSEDVEHRAVPPGVAADHAIASVDDLVGRRLSGPVRGGEMLTDARLLGPGALLGRDPGIVVATVRIADPVELESVGVGELVDIVAVTADGQADGSTARVVAEALEVVATDGDEDDPTGSATLRVAAEQEVAVALAEAAVDARLGVLTVPPDEDR